MNPRDINDVAPPMEIPPGFPWLLLSLVLLGVALITFAWLLWRAFSKKRKGQRRANAKRKALEEIATLRTHRANMNGYQFGIAASDIMRTYLSDSRGWKATQQTSETFLRGIENDQSLPQDSHNRLRQFLRICDHLKYAPVGKTEDPDWDLLEELNMFIREDAGP